MENEKFRLFISQPMSGISIEKIKEDRQRGYEYFKSLGVTDKEIEVIDNLQEDAEDYIATDYLSNDIKLLGYDTSIVGSVVSKFDFEVNQDIAKKEYDKLYKRLSRKYSGSELKNKIRQGLYQKGLSYKEE